MNKKIISALIVISAVIFAALYLSFDRAAVCILAKTRNLDITYEKLNRGSAGEFLFKGLAVTELKSGIGIRSADAKVKFLRDSAVSFYFQNVNFTKKSAPVFWNF